MATPKPLVSVVVPCLNRAHFLVPTIESILKQNYPNIECIVVDGGSTDGTLEILKSYGDRIRWVSEPDSGHADAINKGWWMSKGEILAWLNADDCYVVPDAISKVVDYFQNNPDVSVVYGDYMSIDVNGKVISGIIKPRKWDLVYAVKYCHYTIPQSSSFIRRSILEKVDWLDPEFRNGKDHELWLRIGLAGGKFRYVPVCFSYVRNCYGLSQELSMAAAKINITKKFFSNSNLPPPFNSKHFYRRSLSNSYLVASMYILQGERHFKPLLRYLLKAFLIDPLNLPYIMWKLFRTALPLILPRRLKQVIKRGINALSDFL